MGLRFGKHRFFTFVLVSIFILCSFVPAYSAFYDNFSSGTFDSNLWTVDNQYGTLSIVPGSTVNVSQDYVLHVSATGDPLKVSKLISQSQFDLSSGAGINFFNFSVPSYSTYSTPLSSIGMGIGTDVNTFYVIERAKSQTYNVLVVAKIVNGVTTDPYNVLYGGSSGSLLVNYQNNTLSFGYSTSTDPNSWNSNYSPLHTYENVTLSGNPRILIYTNTGVNGSVSGDVGGLYVASYQPAPVPAAVWLFGTGLLSLLGIRRRYKK